MKILLAFAVFIIYSHARAGKTVQQRSVKRDYKIRTQNPSCSEADTTYTGKSLNRKTARKTDRVGSPAACQGLCQQRKECKFFSWGRKGCWLKKTQGKTRRRRGYVSGPATCEPPKPPIVSTPKPSSSTKPVIITEGPGRGNPCKNGGTKVDGAWTKWFEVGDCNCQTGRKLMVRTCSHPAPEYGGQKCQGDFFTEKSCDKKNCAVDGGWSKWRKAGTCNCETGNVFYVRECNNPTPIRGGQICVGASYEQRACETKDCHVDGAWSQWTEAGGCNCQTGRQVHVRQCNDPPPKNRGQMCQGKSWKEEDCQGYCPEYPEYKGGIIVEPFDYYNDTYLENYKNGGEPMIPVRRTTENTIIEGKEGSSSEEINPEENYSNEYGSTGPIYVDSGDGLDGGISLSELSGDGGDFSDDPNYAAYVPEYDPIPEYEDK